MTNDRVAASADSLVTLVGRERELGRPNTPEISLTITRTLESLAPLEQVDFAELVTRQLRQPDWETTHTRRTLRGALSQSLAAQPVADGPRLTPAEAGLLFRTLVESELQNSRDAAGTELTAVELGGIEAFVDGLRVAVGSDVDLEPLLSRQLDALVVPDARHGITGARAAVASKLEHLFRQPSGGVCLRPVTPQAARPAAAEGAAPWGLQDDPNAFLRGLGRSQYLAMPLSERARLPIGKAPSETQEEVASHCLLGTIGLHGERTQWDTDPCTAADRDEALRALMTLPPKVVRRAAEVSGLARPIFAGLSPEQRLAFLGHLCKGASHTSIRQLVGSAGPLDASSRLLVLEFLAKGPTSRPDELEMLHLFGYDGELVDILKTLHATSDRGVGVISEIDNHPVARFLEGVRGSRPSKAFYELGTELRQRVQSVLIERGGDFSAEERAWVRATWDL